MENNPLTGLLGLLMLLQLAVVLMILLGGLYALYCLNRAASGLDRLASAVENWVSQTAKTQARIAAQPSQLQPSQPLPSQSLPSQPLLSQPLAPTSASAADWLTPIELPHTVSSSNDQTVAATPAINPSATRPNSEGEVQSD